MRRRRSPRFFPVSWRPGWRRDVLPHAYLRDDLWLRMGLAVTESKTDFPRCAGPASI